MGIALETVQRLYATTFDDLDIEGIAPVVAPSITFRGLLQPTDGVDAYVEINRRLLPFHVETRLQIQFEQGEQVCSIFELDLKTPAGDILTVPMADWISVKDGHVASQVVYYDPRPFEAAFEV